MSEIYITEQLLRYLDGEMDQGEHDEWAERIKADADLQDQLNHLNLAREAVQFAGTSARVKSIHESFVRQVSAPVKREAVVTPMYRRKWIRVAAAVTIFLLLTAGWWLSQTTNSSIFEDHYVDFSVSNSRSQGSLSAIEQAYSSGQFDKVPALTLQTPINERDSLLAGISFLKTGQFDRAIQWLTALQSSETFRDDAGYYLAFAWLGKKDDQKALQLFEAIHQNPQHLYHSAVNNDLLRKLRFRL